MKKHDNQTLLLGAVVVVLLLVSASAQPKPRPQEPKKPPYTPPHVPPVHPVDPKPQPHPVDPKPQPKPKPKPKPKTPRSPEEQELIDKLSRLVQKKYGEVNNANWKRLFQDYDANQDGEIDPVELDHLLADADVGNYFTRGMYVAGIMAKLDADLNGKISWDEFRVATGLDPAGNGPDPDRPEPKEKPDPDRPDNYAPYDNPSMDLVAIQYTKGYKPMPSPWPVDVRQGHREIANAVPFVPGEHVERDESSQTYPVIKYVAQDPAHVSAWIPL